MTGGTPRFLVALSFPGEYRRRVGKIAQHLAKRLGRETVLHDKWYKPEFTRPNLDIYLTDLYHEQSRLLVFFLCEAYVQKEWCGLEWRAGRDLLKRGEDDRLMFLRLDDADIPGVYSIDGYLDIKDMPDAKVATAILQRLEGLRATDRNSELREGRFRANSVDAAENEIIQEFDGVPSSRMSDDPTLPSPPNLYCVTDYIPGHKFVGRKLELARISEWASDPSSVLLFTAIGGMGKSMLTWNWVTKHAHEVRKDWAGVFWYSFYEQGSDTKAFCAYALAYTTGRPLKEFVKLKTNVLASELISVLHRKPWLLVLDGLERILVAYQRFDAAQLSEGNVECDPDNSGRRPEACVYPADDSLIRALCGAVPSKVLISSRLVPKSLLNNSECPLPGVEHIELRGLNSADAEQILRDADIKGDSARIRTYLEKHFACHPLVVGVVAGLIRNFLQDPRHFDRWADHPQGGTELHFGTMNLVQRQNHVLKVALSGLRPESRSLLGRLSLISDAVDLDALQALNPYRPVQPEKVDLPLRSSWGSRYYERARDAYDKYLRAAEAWKRAENLANVQLAETIKDLEGRGLLQWDRQNSIFDLHPVVRGCAVDMLSDNERLANGQRVVDYFSAHSDPSYDQASTLSDLRSGLQVVRTYLQIQRYSDAADFLSNGLADALAYKLERYHELLALMRPFFGDGWDQPAKLSGDASLARLLTRWASNAFHRLGYFKRGFSLRRNAISMAVSQRDVPNLIRNIFDDIAALPDGYQFYHEHRALMLAIDLVAISGTKANRCTISLKQAWVEWFGANLKAAEERLRDFDTIKRDAEAPDQVEAERLRGWIRFDQGLLTEEILASAMRSAERQRERFDCRELCELRGLWLQSRSLYAEAESAYEKAARMGREIGAVTFGVESRIALVRAKQGNTASSVEVANRIAHLAQDVDMAELYLALNDREKATKFALAGYKHEWADGMPYSHGRNLQRCRIVLDAVGEPEPILSSFEECKAEPLSYEAEVRALIEELKEGNG